MFDRLAVLEAGDESNKGADQAANNDPGIDRENQVFSIATARPLNTTMGHTNRPSGSQAEVTACPDAVPEETARLV